MVNVTITPLSGSLALDGSIGTKPTPSADTIGYVWASGTNNAGLWYTDGAGTTAQLNAAAGGGDIAGSIGDNYIPIGTAADTIGNFVLGLTENSSIWIGSDPSATTNTASSNNAFGGGALGVITTGDYNDAFGVVALGATTGEEM
jgi:hypothetical protein